MHESSLIADLIAKVEAIARQSASGRVISVRIKVGALCSISPEHLRHHFLVSARGTVAEGANLEIEVVQDPFQRHLDEVVLDSLEVVD